MQPEFRWTGVQATKTPPAGALMAPGGWINPGYPQPEQGPGPDNAINNAYLAEVYTYRCIQSITRSIVGQPFRAGPDINQPGKYSKTAPLAKLLSKDAKGSPNPLWTPVQLLRYAIAQYVLTGKTAWLKGQDADTGANQLWPLMVQKLNPIPGNQKGTQQYFTGYAYGNQGTEGYQELRLDQVAYLYNPSLADVRQPESVIQSGQIQISVARMLAMYDYSFYKNNATPSTLITTPPFSEAAEKRAFQDQFIATYGGYQNAGKTVFAEAEDADMDGKGVSGSIVQVSRLGSTSKEAQMRETNDDYINAICLMWGVPRSVLTDSAGAKYTNMANDRKNYWIETLQPLAAEFADLINLNVAPDLGSEQGWFDLSGVPELKTDTLSIAVTGLDLVLNKAITLDELRSAYGLPPAEEVGLDPDDVGVDDTPAMIISKTNPEPLTDTEKAATAHAAGSDPQELPALPAAAPPKLSVVRSADAIERANQRRDELRRGSASYGTVWKTHHVKGSDDSPCPICAPLDGQVNNGKTPVIDTHPHCNCTNDTQFIPKTSRVSKRSAETRHAGPEGHQHVPSGHNTLPVLRRMFQANMRQLLADQQAETTKRLTGKRGNQMAREARSDANRLYDGDHWQFRIVDMLELLVGEVRARQLAQLHRDGIFASMASAGSLLPEQANTILSNSMDTLLRQIEAEMAFPSEGTG